MNLLRFFFIILTFSFLLLSCSYDKELQKSRDTIRINDLKLYQTDIETFAQNNNYYPDTFSFTTNDPLYQSLGINEECSEWYKYEVINDWEWYILSSCMEAREELLTKDNWKDDSRFEIWNFNSN